MKIKGFESGQFLKFSLNCYGSGNFHYFFRNPLVFQCVLRYSGTKSAANCTFGEKIKLELGNISGLSDALLLYEKMTTMRPLPSVIQFSQLLSRLVKLKEYPMAISLFKDICCLGIPVNEYTMTIAINCYCLSNEVNYGFAILASFFKRGCVPNSITFGTLLKGLFRENRIIEAQELFRKIVREGLCELNVVAYGTVIDGLFKFGNTAVAIELFRVMEKGSCRPDIHIYNMVIDGLCKGGMIDSAMKFFNEMSKKGITPDVVAYSPLISGLCNLSRFKMLLKEMIDSEIHPNLLTFNTLIDAFCKEGLVDEAKDLVQIMVQKNVVPDVVSHGALMDGFCLQGRVDEGRKIFDSMAGKNIALNIHSYSILINGYCRKMKMDDAVHLFLEMPCKG